jgi:general secretion pathway protein J
MTVARAERGFTLVEMLIALAIFGILTAAGVGLLSFSVTAQDFSDRQLKVLTSIRRTGALLNADLAQATPRVWRNDQGQTQPAFFGTQGQQPTLMVLIRSGRDNPQDQPRSDLQRVEYRFQNGRLLRIGVTSVDGGGGGSPTITTLVDEVREVKLRYRDRRGAWRDAWAPDEPADLPAAVEITIATARFGPTRQLFLVGGS